MSEFLTFSQAAAEIPGRPHVSTLHRWRLRGINGVRLRTVRVGGKRMVERIVLREFIEAVTAATDRVPAASRTPTQRERAVVLAEKELADAGW